MPTDTGGDRGKRAPNGQHETEREVDLAEQQEPDLRHAEKDEDGRLNEEVSEILRMQEDRIADVEVNDQRRETKQHRKKSAVTGAQPLQHGAEFILGHWVRDV